MTPLATHFSKSRLMARFQSHQGVHSYKKQETSSGISRSSMASPFLWKRTPWCDWNRAISLEFEKYVAKGVIGETFLPYRFTLAVQTEKRKVEYLHQVTLSQKPFKAPASCACVHFADTWCSDETWCKVKNTMRKELIQPAARSTDQAVSGQQAASSG